MFLKRRSPCQTRGFATVCPSAIPNSARRVATSPLRTFISHTMASATRIQLSPVADCGVFSANIREESARTASELLQHDMENHNVFFNDMGFHSTFSSRGTSHRINCEDRSDNEGKPHRSPGSYDPKLVRPGSFTSRSHSGL